MGFVGSIRSLINPTLIYLAMNFLPFFSTVHFFLFNLLPFYQGSTSPKFCVGRPDDLYLNDFTYRLYNNPLEFCEYYIECINETTHEKKCPDEAKYFNSVTKACQLTRPAGCGMLYSGTCVGTLYGHLPKADRTFCTKVSIFYLMSHKYHLFQVDIYPSWQTF